MTPPIIPRRLFSGMSEQKKAVLADFLMSGFDRTYLLDGGLTGVPVAK